MHNSIFPNEPGIEQYHPSSPSPHPDYRRSNYTTQQYVATDWAKRRRLHANCAEPGSTVDSGRNLYIDSIDLPVPIEVRDFTLEKDSISQEDNKRRDTSASSSESQEARGTDPNKVWCTSKQGLQHNGCNGAASRLNQPPAANVYTQSAHYQEDPRRQIVCYGMLTNFDHVILPEATQDPIDMFWNEGRVSLPSGTTVQLSSRTSEILDALLSVPEVFAELSGVRVGNGQISSSAGKADGPHVASRFVLAVIIYGPMDVADDVGNWLNLMHLHLQTPHSCKTDVLYCNPHKITDASTKPIMTSQLSMRAVSANVSSVYDESILQQLYSTRCFEKALQPALLETRLHPHQLEALTFMQQREQGWLFEAGKHSNDLWKYGSDCFGRKKYVETLTGQSSFRPPPSFRGGLVADEMGLGKTCSLLALIASDIQSNSELEPPTASEQTAARKSTLIVVPLSLLQVWETQMQQHLRSGAIVSQVFHKSQKCSPNSFDDSDIVLTTYETVSSEWKRINTCPTSYAPISAKFWHRIILDEAHVIKNKDTDVAKAVTALTADRRWCITGTPIQNRTSDLFSLLRFLKVYPYHDFKKFDQVFLQPWRNAETDALRKLQYLMGALAIRRPRTIINLPQKVELVIPVSLDSQERVVYEQTKQGLVDIVDAAFRIDKGPNSYYLNALQRINDLRYVCNHGKVPQRRTPPKLSVKSERPNTVQRELTLLFGDDSEGPCTPGNLSVQIGLQQHPSPSLTVTDSENSLQCSRSVSPAMLQTDLSILVDESSTSALVPSALHISSKVRALIDDIKRTPLHEKCVVFSFWTSTLNLISHALKTHSIPHSRYDGDMSRAKRDTVLDSFSSSTAATKKVILVSISCGGQGLDLTAANHAYLVEPQWNPMSEEQALSRVHRLGQTREVRLCRLVANDTWEQQIVRLQERKRKLAELIVDRGMLDKASKSTGLHEHTTSNDDDAKRLMRLLKDLLC